MKKIDGGVTAAKGFSAAAAAAEIKYKGRTDMAMIVSETDAVCAGTFTRNVVKAAPVRWDMDIVYSGKAVRSIVANSGIANAATGENGRRCCEKTAQLCAEALGIKKDQVLLGSTGVIGMTLPMDRIENGIKELSKNLSSELSAGLEAERAIMTTDTKPKQSAYGFEIDGVTVTVGGMSKGSGMIHPNMSTMLCYITTDASIEKELLQEALSAIVKDTFNMISVDGDTSTNDTCIVLANGASGSRHIAEKDEYYEAFYEALLNVCTDLAVEMAADGEGATKLMEAVVTNADTKENARVLARSVVSSDLTKSAVYGCDANWGRQMCAIGYSGVDFDPEKVDLYFESGEKSLLIVKDGVDAGYDEKEASDILANECVRFVFDMHMGDACATAWGCDLTYDYVKINADYRS